MPTIEKLQSGFMYKEDFSKDNIMWQFFPNDNTRYERRSNSIVLKYGEGKVIALTKAPAENFVMQCRVKHTPLSTNSFAGVLLLKDGDDLVECESYKDPDLTAQDYYPYIKISKVDYNYYFYASLDGRTWVPIGAVAYTDCHLIGFFFETDNANEEFLIEDITFYKSPIVTVSNIRNDASTIQILKSGVPVKSTSVNTGVATFDLTQTLLPIQNVQIRMLNYSGGILQTTTFDSLCGGDQYGVFHNIKMSVNGQVIDHNQPFDLGKIYGGTEVLLTLENLDVNYTVFDLKLSVQRYSPYDAGHENVELIFETHDEGTPYSKELTIPVLRSGEPINILMKVERLSDIAALFKTHGFKYKLILE